MALLTMIRKPKVDSSVDPLTEDGAATGPVSVHHWPDPAKPAALLVPRYVRDNKAAAGTQRHVYAGLGATALGVVAAVVTSILLAHASSADLIAAQAVQGSAQTKVDNLSSIASYYDGLEQRRLATESLLITDIKHAALFDTLYRSLPAGVTLGSYSTAIGAPCAGPNPFVSPNNIGCLAVGGTADSPSDVSAMLQNFKKGAAADILSEAFVTQITGAGGAGGSTSFTVNVNFTSDAFSLKYVPAEDAAAAAAKATAQVLANQIGATP